MSPGSTETANVDVTTTLNNNNNNTNICNANNVSKHTESEAQKCQGGD